MGCRPRRPAAAMSAMSNYFHAWQPNGILTQFVLGEPILFMGTMTRFYSSIVHITTDRKRFRIMFHSASLPIQACSKDLDYELRKVPYEGVCTMAPCENIHGCKVYPICFYWQAMCAVQTGYIGLKVLQPCLRIAWHNYLYCIAPRMEIATTHVRQCFECDNFGCVKCGDTMRRCGECTYPNVPVTNGAEEDDGKADWDAAKTAEAMLAVDRVVAEFLDDLC